MIILEKKKWRGVKMMTTLNLGNDLIIGLRLNCLKEIKENWRIKTNNKISQWISLLFVQKLISKIYNLYNDVDNTYRYWFTFLQMKLSYFLTLF